MTSETPNRAGGKSEIVLLIQIVQLGLALPDHDR
jgi:hypothetical protein